MKLKAFMLKDGILSFMKDYPILCVSEEFNEDDEYDDDDDDDDYYYNEGLYKTIDNNNTLNESYTNTIEMVDIKDNNYESTDNNQDINTIFNSTNITNDINYTETSNSSLNDIDMTNANQYQTNDIAMENNIIQNQTNDTSISLENGMDNNAYTRISNNDNEYEQTDKKRKIDNTSYNDNLNSLLTDDMDCQASEEILNKEDNSVNNMIMEDNNANTNEGEAIKAENENVINNEITQDTLTDTTPTEPESEIKTEGEGDKVTDSMACYDPRQMASVNVDYNNNNKLLKNNQTEEIIKLRKFQRYLIHNVWYAMDNSNDVPLMVCPPFLYLGSLYTSQEHHLIKYNIKHVIRLGTDFNISYNEPSRFNFYNFDIFDLPKEPIKELFKRANDIIEKARLNHENVLVHCHAGVSRSSTIILAYLMRYKGMSLYDAWCSTFKIRPIIR